MAQLFEKVELRDEGELIKIQRLLDEALEARLQNAAADELTDADKEQLRSVSGEFVAQLRRFVVFAEAESGPHGASMQRTQATPAPASLGLRSPLLQPLSPPPADCEVQQLEGEVTAASLRVAELRTGMQSRLQEMLAAKLAACRPSAELEPGAAHDAAAEQRCVALAGAPERQDGDASLPGQQQAFDGQAAPQLQQQPEQQAGDGGPPAGAAEQAAPAAPLSPQPAELQQRLLQAANRMPALRAQLEQAADRLQRVVTAVAADINRPPPNTVEKAVLGKTPGRPGAGAAAGGEENGEGVSPLFQQALESGQISTRRRVARDVQPVPYNSQQD